MELDDFIKAERVVKKIRYLEREHDQVQEVIAGDLPDLIITTENGEVIISDRKRISNICCVIDSSYFDEEEKLKLELKDI